ncbi:MAG TPA: condensation domain-containing protein [Blastocatellia bacterium]|nr:condensation domain-containing protein [Blastocatellia bacterium]
MNDPATSARAELDVAIIGMAGRFPQAGCVDEFWQNVRDGKECISFFTEQEMESAGVGPATYRNPHYVRAGGVLKDFDRFDARFFGYSAREAEIIDPQQRLFLECAWEALEQAAYNSERYDGVIGVYGGASMSRYLRNLYSNPELVASVGVFQIGLANDKDFLSTRVSYKLNLEGPSITVQTACSTSLVAIHLACQSLLGGECDMAIAGGVRAGEEAGYLYHDGGIASPDGHCRAFDARAQGTLGGNGVGVVVLKRLEDAMADGDYIHAVIKGTAINNDGNLKVGYTAPRIEGQAAVIRAAHLAAGVEPDSIQYVEAHGTGTELGDPIEIAALTKAFRARTRRTGFCALGSVKTNIGHLDVAAGIAGLIKTVMALKHKMIPPSLHFTEPNPKIDFANSPFYVNTALREWSSEGRPRRAGVSSFGMGGTNAHIVLEEAPPPPPPAPSRHWQLLLLSARTREALQAGTANLADHLQQHADLNLADVAHTLREGRRRFSHRRMLVCDGSAAALEVLRAGDDKAMPTTACEANDRPIAFMFSGLGEQYVNMARGIYRSEPLFRKQVDECCEMLRPLLGRDLRGALFADAGQAAKTPPVGTPPALDLRRLLRGGAGCANQAAQELHQTALAQPALFVIEYALARLWMTWGVRPAGMIGYSIGEYVAACLSGVFSLEDALTLVARRAQMIHQLPAGAMLATPLSEAELRTMLDERLSLAAVNGPSLCVVAGSVEAVDRLQGELTAKGIATRRLQASHAFHSRMMDPIAEPFAELFNHIELHPPAIPYVSNVTGDWITVEEATDPHYWARHMCQAVRFADGIERLWAEPQTVLLEVGPGQSLSSLSILHPANDRSADRVVLSSLPSSLDPQPDEAFLLTTLGKLWLAGASLDWDAFRAEEKRRRVPLPTYAFERQRYWVERQNTPAATAQGGADRLAKLPEVADWLYLPVWKRRPVIREREGKADAARALLFVPEGALAGRMAARLRQAGWAVTTVEASESFTAGGSAYGLNPEARSDYDRLLDHLIEDDQVPELIVHLWQAVPGGEPEPAFEYFAASQYLGFYSLVFLAQALSKRAITKPLRLCAITSGMQDITGEEELCPDKMTLLGPLKTMPQEYPNIECRSIDVRLPRPGSREEAELIDQLYEEVVSDSADTVVAFRGHRRWAQEFEAIPPAARAATDPGWRESGVYLIVGGLGQIGLVLAEALAKSVQARLVLVGRSPFPPRAQWADWLARHGDADQTSGKIRKLLALEELGSEVLTLNADLGDATQMRSVLTQTVERFGALHGVIHAAGVVGEQSFRSIQATGEVEYGWHVRPKVEGLLVLEEVLRGHHLDFCLLFSSLTSVLGGLGFTAYTAANLFIDAFASKHNRGDSTPWISLGSDAWRFASEGGDATTGAALGLGDLALTPEEGVEMVRRALALKRFGHLVVSTAPLQPRIDRWVKLESLRQAKPSERGAGLTLHARPNLQSPFVAPANAVETTLVGLWQELLGFEPISIDDNFFELGGHSLLIVQMISRLRDLFRTEIPMEAVFVTPTIAGLARRIETATQNEPAVETPPLVPAGGDGPAPLSYAQQRLWFMDQLKPGNSAYNLENPVRLSGRLSTAGLEQTLAEIERRHDILRTSFAMRDGSPVQVSAPPRHVKLPLVDLSALPEADKQAIARRLALEEADRPFDLAQSPLSRAALLRLGTEQHLLLFTLHHIVSDAWSMDVLIGEVSHLYRAFSAGHASPLAELALQYADYALWQRQWLQGEVLEAQLAYWKKQLAGSPALLALPTDRPRPKVQNFAGASQAFSFAPSLAAALRRLSSQERVTMFMTLLAGFQALLHRYTGEDDIVVGSPVANRHRREIEPLIGFFVNPLVLRTDLSANPTFKELLVRVRDVTLGAQAHQDLPFELLVEALQPQRMTNYTPLFQVVFVLDHISGRRDAILPGLTLAAFEMDTNTSPIDLHLAITDFGEEVQGLFTYDRNLFDEQTIAEMIESFIALLAAVSADPERRILDVSLRPLDGLECAAASASNDPAQAAEGQFLF